MLSQKCLSYSFRINFHRCFLTSQRWKSQTYKEKQREKRRYTLKALAQFDDFYGSVFQEQWPSIRIALLSAEKEAVVSNNFSDKKRVLKKLQNDGAFNVREVFEAQKVFLKEKSQDQLQERPADIYQIDGRIEEALLRQQRADFDGIYPEPLDFEAAGEITRNLSKQPSENVTDDGMEEGSKILDPTRDQPLTESLKSADYDTTRLIIPGASGVTMSASLYDYVPTTKLRGMDDYIPESAHYNYYKEGAEVPIEFDVEDEIEFPKQLDVYAFERGNCDTFDYSGKGSTNVLDYHILSLGFLAPVLALGLRKGDCVLDLTSSSLDVAMLISQTLIPEMFVANREDSKEAQYLLRSLSSYIFDIHGDDSNIMVTDTHPLVIEDHNKFDKIFLSVPSTYDRKAVNFEEENLFNPARVKERIKLPEEQTAYLRKALELVREGGTVVYCTESLSPIQNDSVVQQALEDLWLKSSCKYIVKDLSRGLEPLLPFMKITKSGKFGHYVLPFLPNNCGPLYFSKIVKPYTT